MLKKIFKKILVAILQLEAKLVLAKYKPKIIAITGSVGKTSTKDAIYAVLSRFYFVRKSEKSFNSELGVPLTILGCPNAWYNPFLWFRNILEGLSLILQRKKYPEWLVLEVGADRPGDIKNLSYWLKPDVSVITKISVVPVHVEHFSSPESLAKEKWQLVKALKSGGTLIINHDDYIIKKQKIPAGARVFSFGFEDGATVRGVNNVVFYEKFFPSGIGFKVETEGSVLPVKLKGVLGKSPVYAALAALAVGKSLNLNTISMLEGLSTWITPPGRLKLVWGIKNSLIIDDSYNASPDAMRVALETLKELKVEGKKIAVLGDMLELGKFSIAEHKEIGKLAGEVVSILVTVGLRARGIAEGALIAGLSEKNIFQFEDSLEAGKHVQNLIGLGDVVLVKGSQGKRMEKVVEEIMLHPEDKEKILVRQDEEWKKR